MPKITKRIHKKNATTRRKRGGDQEVNLDQYKITNTETIIFLIRFLSKEGLEAIILSNYKFIDSLENLENTEEKLAFDGNPEFRKIINDVIQWFLFDYNDQFSNVLLEIIKNTIGNTEFLNNPEQNYNILLLNVYNMIDKYNNTDQIEFFSLLEIFLRILRMPKVKEIIVSTIQTQKTSLIQYKDSIVCLLDSIIKNDLLHKPEIRKLIQEIIQELTYKNIYNWNTITKLIGVVKGCALSVTSNLLSSFTKSIW